MSKLICQVGAVLFPSAVQVLSASIAHLDMPVTVRLGIARPHQQGCDLAPRLFAHKGFCLIKHKTEQFALTRRF